MNRDGRLVKAIAIMALHLAADFIRDAPTLPKSARGKSRSYWIEADKKKSLRRRII